MVVRCKGAGCACGSHDGDEHRPEAIVDEALGALLSSLDLPVVIQRTSALVRRRFGATRFVVHRLVEGEPGVAEEILVDEPRTGASRSGTRVALSGTAAAEAIRSNWPVIVDPLAAAGGRFAEEAQLAALGYGALACFPLVVEERPLGTLTIAHPPRRGILDCCLAAAGQVARLLAIAMHNATMVDEIRRLARLLDRENTRLREELRETRGDRRYVAESATMRAVVERVSRVAPTPSTVLIRGETGTGKEGLARMVHDFSPRFGQPFVVVNLGALPETLIESELFGHERGAFTGATARKVGRFEQAAGGTLFLDEIGDAPPAVQVRLLRVLQEREVHRVGGREAVPVDVRVIAATNRPLEAMVADGTFRADLYYRLSAFPVELPPLRERREDIRPLARYFLARHAARMNRRPPSVSEPVAQLLEGRDWPGNVRELENFLEHALILCPGPELTLADLPASHAPRREAPATLPGGTFDAQVRELLRRALDDSGGRIYGPSGAAARLGLKPTTLQGKLRRHRLRYAR